MKQSRRLPVGAEVLAEGGVHFRVWAPRRRQIDVVFETRDDNQLERQPRSVRLEPEGNGYFSGHVPDAAGGALYRYRLDGSRELYPDPASRFQPDGPHGPSQVIDPARFDWTDNTWPGTPLQGQVIYELHIGTFTQEGTWEAASRHLRDLASLGITVIEVMPV